jgi:hypothetical protein
MGLGVKQPGLEADHAPVAEEKNDWICISYPPYCFWHAQDNITSFRIT